MKKLIILFTFLGSVLVAYSQSGPSDEVYPANGNKPYLNCKILEIQNGNEITFVYKGETLSLKAISVKKNGEYFNLSKYMKEDSKDANIQMSSEIYNGHSYQFYQNELRRAERQARSGLALGITGMAMVTFGIITFDNKPEVNPGTQDVPIFLMIGGGLLTVYGVPAFFFGRKKSAKNQEIIRNFPAHQTKLGISTSNNGLSLILRF